MTPEALAAIAARNAARTQGTWTSEPVLFAGQSADGLTSWGESTGRLINGPPQTWEPETSSARWFTRKEDGDFIAHATEDIPALLAEVARLTASLAEAESRNSEFSWEYAAQIAERFGVNESDRRKFGNEMAEVFRAMVRP